MVSDQQTDAEGGLEVPDGPTEPDELCQEAREQQVAHGGAHAPQIASGQPASRLTHPPPVHALHRTAYSGREQGVMNKL